jgi:uncharacterized iron-regulated membrane protein
LEPQLANGSPASSSSGAWQRWLRQPQRVWARRVLFQVHLWSGLGLGLYVFAISLSGSVLVYRNELMRRFNPPPRLVAESGPRLSPQELEERIRRQFPDSEVSDVRAGKAQNQATEVRLTRHGRGMQRLFDPFTGKDLGHALPLGFRVVLWVKDFHDNLLNDIPGRRTNGVGGVLFVLLGITGVVIWWPGVKTWKRSLGIVWRTSWNRFTWHLHSALGFWSLAFVIMWGLTGAYLSYPDPFNAAVEYLQPLDESNPVDRLGDTVLYWFAYLHFGRFRGRLASCGVACGSTLQFVWALVGLIPPAMFVTGAIMWWNRVVSPRRRASVVAESQLLSPTP